MTVDELLNLVCEGLEIEPGTLTLQTKIEDVEQWDSVGWLSIMALVDERLNVQITPSAVRSFRIVKDLVDHVAAKTRIDR